MSWSYRKRGNEGQICATCGCVGVWGLEDLGTLCSSPQPGLGPWPREAGHGVAWGMCCAGVPVSKHVLGASGAAQGP